MIRLLRFYALILAALVPWLFALRSLADLFQLLTR